MWKFSPGTGGEWTHRRAVAVTGLPAGGADAVFNVVVDTAALIAAGKMRADCGDVRFKLPEPSGAAVSHWVAGARNYRSPPHRHALRTLVS